MSALRELRRKVIQRMRRLLEVRRWLAILITASPPVQRKSISQEHVLLNLSPAHADARVAACAPAHDCEELTLVAIADKTWD